MAKHYKKRHQHHHWHNPFGVSSGLLTESAWNATGALGTLWLGGTLSNMASVGGWGAVLGTAGAAIALGFVGKTFGGAKASEEMLKGGLVATIIKAVHQLGIAQNIGLGLYQPSWFSIPSSSDQYLRAAAPNMAWNRGAGSIWFPGPGGQQLALPAGVHPAAAAAALRGMGNVGFHRFRSRYAGNY